MDLVNTVLILDKLITASKENVKDMIVSLSVCNTVNKVPNRTLCLFVNMLGD